MGIPAWIKSLTVPLALVLIAAAIVFYGLVSSPMGIGIVVAVAAGAAYWWWKRQPASPEA